MKHYIDSEASYVSGVNTSDITTTDVTLIIAAQGDNTRVYIGSIVVTNSSATGTVVKILDGSTVKARVYAKAEGGAAFVCEKPLRGTANTAWNAECETTGAAVQVNLFGFKRIEG